MSGYQQDTIIDCNSRASEEAKGQQEDQNNSIYTNKIGVGVKVNPGDVVSVHSGYISKRGAGDATIELTGKSSGKYITLKKLTKIDHQKQILNSNGYSTNVAIPNYAEVVEEYGCVEYKEEDVKYELKDNEVNFNISYYKTTNGEGYYHLPRRYDAWKSQFHNDTLAGPSIQVNWAGLVSNDAYAAQPWIPATTTTPGGWQPGERDVAVVQGNIRCREDCWKNGRSDAFVFDMTGRGVSGMPTPPVSGENYYRYAYSNQYRRCLADIYFYPKIHPEVGNGQVIGVAPNTGDTAKTYIPGTAIGPRAETGNFSATWKKKNDNSRYTIFVKELSYFSNRSPTAWFHPKIDRIESNSVTGEKTKNLSMSRNDYLANQTGIDTAIFLEGRDPAMSEYIKYTETKTLSLPEGEYTPSDIASELTNQLNISGKTQTILGSVAFEGYPTSAADPGAGAPTFPPNVNSGDDNLGQFASTQVPVSTYTESTTYKTFHTATSVSVEEKAFSDFCKEDHSYVETEPAYHRSGTITAINYLSSYQCIGVKRPDLFLAGRKVMKELGYRVIGENNATAIDNGDYNGDITFGIGALWLQQKPETNEVINGLSPAGPLHGTVGGNGWSYKQMINPYVSRELNKDNRLTDVIPTSWSWTEENLKGLKEYFDIQGKYSDLFDGMVSETTDNEKRISSDNSRFLHINSHDTRRKVLNDPSGLSQNWTNPLGTDFMIDLAPSNGESWSSIDHTKYPTEGDQNTFFIPYPGKSGGGADKLTGSRGLCGTNAIFFYFDKSRTDVAGGGTSVAADGSAVDSNLYYGLFHKQVVRNPYSGLDEYVIAVCPARVGGIPAQLYHTKVGGAELVISDDLSRTIGIDLHFSAYGTSAINLYAGQLSQESKDLTPEDLWDDIRLEYVAGYYSDNWQGGNKYKATTYAGAPPVTIATTGFPLGASFTDLNGNVAGRYRLNNPDGQRYDAQRNVRPLHQYLQKRYIGADNPSLSFDSTQSRFNFVDLHTPERVGNIVNAGSSAENPIVADTNDKVYFVNKRLLKKEFCPDMFPYEDLNPSSVNKDANPQDTTYSTFFNDNITSWSIMDADSGIFIEDFGFDNVFGLPSNSADLTSWDWRETLWHVLGFSYEQFHTSPQLQSLDRQTRINNIVKVDNIGKPTTNANVEPADLSQYITNIFGAELRTTQLPCIIGNLFTGFSPEIVDLTGNTDPDWEKELGPSIKPNFRNPLIQKSLFKYLPGATVSQKSAQINAENLPIKQRNPYYLIKSDIVNDSNYLGSDDSGQALNIVAVVPKQSGSSDFFFQTAGQQQFTVTQPRVITSIKTQILNPDGSLSKLDEGTSVIYKVSKINQASLTVAQDMIQKAQKK